MPRRGVNFDLAAEAVAMGDTFRSDTRAAQHFGITVRTIQRYRQMAASDRNLSEKIAIKKSELRATVQDWAPAAAETLRFAVERLHDMLERAGDDKMRDVVGAIKILGDLDIVKRAMKAESDEAPTTNITVVNQIANGQPALPH